MAIWKPDPSAVWRLMAASRSWASSVSDPRGGKNRYAKARSAERPTRPRIW